MANLTVRELLKQLTPLLSTHEVTTLWSENISTTLIIDIEHNHDFHATGYIKRYTLESNTNLEYYILKPFEHSYYDGMKYENGKGERYMYSVLDDLIVYRWKLYDANHDDRIWKLEIQTHQT